MYSRLLILQRHVAGKNKSIFHSFLHVRVASSMIQNQPPDQPARLKTILGVSGHKYRISWSAESGTAPTQTAWALLLAVNKDDVFPFPGHAHSIKKHTRHSGKKEFALAWCLTASATEESWCRIQPCTEGNGNPVEYPIHNPVCIYQMLLCIEQVPA